MFTTAILTFFFCWNDFLFAISLTSTDNARTAPAALASSRRVVLPVGGALRHGGIGRRDDPRGHPGVDLPAPDRRGLTSGAVKG